MEESAIRRSTGLELFISHRGALVDYAGDIMGDRGRGEDIVQEAWMRFDAVSNRRLLEKPVGYLYRIVRNLALDGRRRARRENVVVTDGFDAAAETSADTRPTAEVVVISKDELAHLVRAIAELPERTRIALEMHRVGGCKLREIAEFLDISLPLAHVLVADGVRHCKRRLGVS